MNEPRPEAQPVPEADVWDSPAQREYEADPAAYEARAAARYAELQADRVAAARLQTDREIEAEDRFWALLEAEDEIELEIELEAE
jgi:hypothetical protein